MVFTGYIQTHSLKLKIQKSSTSHCEIRSLFCKVHCVLEKGFYSWSFSKAGATKYVHIKSTTVYAPRRNWDSPQPPSRRLVRPLPPVSGGRGTLAGEKGVGRVRRRAYTVVLFICTYFVPGAIGIRLLIKGCSVTRFFASGFFHESVSPQPQSIPLRPFRVFF